MSTEGRRGGLLPTSHPGSQTDGDANSSHFPGFGGRGAVGLLTPVPGRAAHSLPPPVIGEGGLQSTPELKWVEKYSLNKCPQPVSMKSPKDPTAPAS